MASLDLSKSVLLSPGCLDAWPSSPEGLTQLAGRGPRARVCSSAMMLTCSRGGEPLFSALVPGWCCPLREEGIGQVASGVSCPRASQVLELYDAHE